MSRRERRSQRLFFGVSALLFFFAASVGLTIAWSTSMSAMGGMSMPGGWTMSMMWMRMPGQTWAGMAASFVGMWVVMMVAMMLPSLLPMLGRYREVVGGSGDARVGWLSGLVGMGYFGVWAAVGLVVFPLGAVLSTITMQEPVVARAVPIGIGALVLAAGAFQFSEWKRRRLADCREVPGSNHVLPAAAGTAWRHGVRLGLHCCHSCAGLMTIALIGGLMDLRVMAVVTAAITAERLAPNGVQVARAIGIVVIGAGVWMLVARV